MWKGRVQGRSVKGRVVVSGACVLVNTYILFFFGGCGCMFIASTWHIAVVRILLM